MAFPIDLRRCQILGLAGTAFLFLALRGLWFVTHMHKRLDRIEQCSANVINNVRAGLELTAKDIAAAEQVRGEIWQRVRRLLERFDHLVTPCMAVPPFQVEQNYADPVNPDKAIYNGAIPGMLHVLDPHSNFFDPKQGPRDPSNLSPHTHDDFEQCSIVLAGEYVHHIRWPWTTNKAHWREDEHQRVAAPSVTVIPPPSLHTSEAVAAGTNHLIDVFCPPRFDFSDMEGWVFNAADYPAQER